MELCRGRISALHSSSMLRPVYTPRGCRRLPFGSFSQPPQHFAVVGVSTPSPLFLLLLPSNRNSDARHGGAFSRSILLPLSLAGAEMQQGAAAAAGLGPEQRHACPRLAHPRRRRLPRRCPPQPHRFRHCRCLRRVQVVPRGVECKRVGPGVSDSALHELLWTWDSLTTATCCKSFVVVYGRNCVLQIGVAAGSPEDGNAFTADVQKFIQGSLYTNAMESKRQSYLANLALYPGRSELPFLPANTQALILQPIGDKGIAVIGGDTIRGFTSIDQAWIAMIGDKLDATLSKS